MCSVKCKTAQFAPETTNVLLVMEISNFQLLRHLVLLAQKFLDV